MLIIIRKNDDFYRFLVPGHCVHLFPPDIFLNFLVHGLNKSLNYTDIYVTLVIIDFE